MLEQNQIAVIWTMYEEQRSATASRGNAEMWPRPSFARNMRGQVRRFVYRAQLGPVIGHPA